MMLPLLTVAANFSGVVMGWVTNTLIEPISLRLFLADSFREVAFSDYLTPILKTVVFGTIIGIVACFQGMRTRGGTEGVGRSTTSSVRGRRCPRRRHSSGYRPPNLASAPTGSKGARGDGPAG